MGKKNKKETTEDDTKKSHNEESKKPEIIHKHKKETSEDELKRSFDEENKKSEVIHKPKKQKKKRQDANVVTTDSANEKAEENSNLENLQDMAKPTVIEKKKRERKIKKDKMKIDTLNEPVAENTNIKEENLLVTNDVFAEEPVVTGIKSETEPPHNQFADTLPTEKGVEQIDVKIKKSKKHNSVEEEKVIDWPEKDLSELFKRMEAAIPEKDTLAYSTRVEKLNWDDISFKNYTGEECKSTWLLVQKRLRRFRLLSELLKDAKEWTSKPWTNFYGGQKTKRHPDMPRRPLSTYMLFYIHKKDKIIEENPRLEMTEISKLITQMYKALSPAKREKYMKEAAEKRRIYEVELEEFYRQHPEIARNMEKTSHQKPVIEPGPKKPNTPFTLYYESQLKSLDPNVVVCKNTFKEQCKEQWKNMSDKKKVIWINWALDEEAKYQDELKSYISQNPDFVPVTVKPVLTKEEKSIKERMAGKPTKPPNSAYSLFSRMMLQSDEIKEVNPKDRMVYIAEKWKNCTEEERKEYSERILHLREQYKLDFASYLESLPEEKRQEELRNTLPKRKRNPSKSEEKEVIAKKKKPEQDEVENNNLKSKKTLKGDKKTEQDKTDSAEEKQKSDPFTKPPYWNRMKKEEKRTFRNAMLKLKEHLDSRFEKYTSSRGSEEESEEDSDSEESDGSSASS